MCCRDRQAPGLFIPELVCGLLDTLNFPEYLASLFNNGVSNGCYVGQMLATAGENFDPKFVFKQTYLFADSGLRGVKTLGGGRHVQVVVGNLPDIPELL